MRKLAGLALVLLALGACGQRGPLYLPEKTETAIHAPAAPPAAAPAATPAAAEEPKPDTAPPKKPVTSP